MSLAIFDDREEIWSAGRLPPGIPAEALTQEHVSRPRNPLIAEVFYRAGLIEKCGRGTNRVVAQCLAAKIPAPEFREIAGTVEVTFRVPVTGTPHVTPHVAPHVTSQVTPQVAAVLRSAAEGTVARDGLMAAAGVADRWRFPKADLDPWRQPGGSSERSATKRGAASTSTGRQRPVRLRWHWCSGDRNERSEDPLESAREPHGRETIACPFTRSWPSTASSRRTSPCSAFVTGARAARPRRLRWRSEPMRLDARRSDG